jgi:hypothetical protein
VIFVGDERERQVVLLLELGVRLRRVGADAEYDRVESLEPREGVPEGTRFDRSARGVVFRIEEEDDVVALVVGE